MQLVFMKYTSNTWHVSRNRDQKKTLASHDDQRTQFEFGSESPVERERAHVRVSKPLRVMNY